VRERPILFSGPMVRAILDGRKTQTRRAVKPQPIPYGEASPMANKMHPDAVGKPWIPVGGVFQEEWRCPYGVVRDRLWVRETWAPHADVPGEAIYRCDRGGDYQDNVTEGFRWRPSIHMPRWASRITLEIVSIRVERLQEISEEDAKAEGTERGVWSQSAGLFMEPCDDSDDKHASYRDGFGFLWSSIYGNWDANPWVWVVEFRRVEK